mmetsp:Transcript_11154/g.48190  ORF Transcript_11154/g.48190 Transcript_11154/m.48190 type:complete len:211 (+) Transcript_11154:408-1040(+)
MGDALPPLLRRERRAAMGQEDQRWRVPQGHRAHRVVGTRGQDGHVHRQRVPFPARHGRGDLHHRGGPRTTAHGNHQDAHRPRQASTSGLVDPRHLRHRRAVPPRQVRLPREPGAKDRARGDSEVACRRQGGASPARRIRALAHPQLRACAREDPRGHFQAVARARGGRGREGLAKVHAQPAPRKQRAERRRPRGGIPRGVRAIHIREGSA